MSKLSRGTQVTLIDQEASIYKGKIEKLEADPPSLFLKTYDNSQSRFVSQGFPPKEIQRIHYKTSSMLPALAGAVLGGTLGGVIGNSYENNSELNIEHATLGVAFLGGFIGGVIGGLLTPSTQHVIDCP